MATRWGRGQRRSLGGAPWVARPGRRVQSQPLPGSRCPRRRGPFAWEAGGPAPSSCGLRLRPVRSRVANEGQMGSIRGGLHPNLAFQAGAGEPGDELGKGGLLVQL